MGKGKFSLPDRWLDYISIGQEIRGVPIIACKVPLNEGILRAIPTCKREWFSPESLVEMVPNVGCIVDLTATNRYYNPTVFTDRGIHYAKILCAGHVIPNKKTVKSFFQVVDDFLHSIHSRGKVLMVHCTHGLNRTGYLVSRYMIERRGIRPEDAIQAFNNARGHNIERENYLKDLLRMSQLIFPNPIPLYEKRELHPSYAEQPVTECMLQRPRLGQHRNVAEMPVSYSQPPLATINNRPNKKWIFTESEDDNNRELHPSNAEQPLTEYMLQRPRRGQHRNVAEMPVSYSQPPSLATINNRPNKKWIFTEWVKSEDDNQLSSSHRSRSQSEVNHQPTSVISDPPPNSNARRRKPKPKRPKPQPVPSLSTVAPSSEHLLSRGKRRKSRLHDSSIGAQSASSIEICYDSRQDKSPNLPPHLTSRHQVQQSGAGGTLSSASKQDFLPPENLRRKKKRSKGSKGTGSLNESSSKPSL